MIRIKTGLFLIICVLATCFQNNCVAQNVSARLDSVNLLMGNLMTLHLEVVENKGDKGGFQIFKNIDPAKGYVAVCGDSVELRSSYTIDTVDLGSGKIQLNYSVPVQAFDSGTYTLPRFVYVNGSDTFRSNQLTFNVVPVAVTASDPIAPFASVVEPDGKRFYDWVPDWILDFWWIFIVIVIAICLFYWSMRKYRKEGFLPKILSKPVVQPWDAALSALEKLKSRKLWEQGFEKEYFTELTDILRKYLNDRFGINAMEMTSRQIMDKIYQSDLRDKKDYVNHILSVADFVKFAKVRPLPADSIAAYDNAVNFIEETIPVSDNKEESEIEEGGEGR